MIAFDIDGCANCMKEDVIRLGSGFFSEFDIEFDPSGYYLKEIFSGAPEDAYNMFWEEYGYDIFTAPPREFVSETIEFIRARNLTACYITTRDTTRTFRGIPFDELTREWLKRYDIELPVWYQKDKAQIAKKLGVRLMVEDKPENILKLRPANKSQPLK